MNITWSLTTIPLKQLKPHPSNPRTLTKKQYEDLKTSIDKFGLIDRIVVNLDFVIIGGHQRYQILKKDKAPQVECWIPNRLLTEQEVQELMIRLNKNSGNWNYDTLANDFNVPDLIDWGFTPQEMELVLDEVPENEPKTKKAKKLTECPSCGHIF